HISEPFWSHSMRLMVVGLTNSNHFYVGIVESSLPTHPVEFRDRSARGEKNGADILCGGLKKEPRWNLLLSELMIIDFGWRQDQFAIIVMVPFVSSPVQVVRKRS